MTKTFNAYFDPGHGWVKVERKLLDAMGLLDKISSYSYQRKGFVFLEEDCDYTTFAIACREHGIEVKIAYHSTDRYSKIRNYESYKA